MNTDINEAIQPKGDEEKGLATAASVPKLNKNFYRTTENSAAKTKIQTTFKLEPLVPETISEEPLT